MEKNRTGVTYSEINDTKKQLKKCSIYKLENLKLLLGSPKFIDPSEISIQEHIRQLSQNISTLIFSIGLADLVGQDGKKLFEIIYWIFIVWLTMGLFYRIIKNNFSSYQKLKQVEYLLPELIEQVLKEKEAIGNT